MKSIAFFDFDGTITRRDTLFAFIFFCKGTLKACKGLLLCSPVLVAYKLGFISNQRAKEKLMRFFFGGCALPVFEKYCKAFVQERLPGLMRSKALETLHSLRQSGVLIVIVSASPEKWIKPWADANGFELIATQLQVKGNCITGTISGKNCHGAEKVARIKQQFLLNEYSNVYAYGDTKGDLPMLSLATESFYKPFRN